MLFQVGRVFRGALYSECFDVFHILPSKIPLHKGLLSQLLCCVVHLYCPRSMAGSAKSVLSES